MFLQDRDRKGLSVWYNSVVTFDALTQPGRPMFAIDR
jgi:hypothetical protein